MTNTRLQGDAQGRCARAGVARPAQPGQRSSCIPQDAGNALQRFSTPIFKRAQRARKHTRSMSTCMVTAFAKKNSHCVRLRQSLSVGGAQVDGAGLVRLHDAWHADRVAFLYHAQVTLAFLSYTQVPPYARHCPAHATVCCHATCLSFYFPAPHPLVLSCVRAPSTACH